MDLKVIGFADSKILTYSSFADAIMCCLAEYCWYRYLLKNGNWAEYSEANVVDHDKINSKNCICTLFLMRYGTGTDSVAELEA